MANYKNSTIEEFKEQQLQFTSRQGRLEQIDRAEKLLGEIDPCDTYSYRRFYERITRNRFDGESRLKIEGREAVHDLRCFVEDLSESVEMTVESIKEPVLTIEDLCRKYHVSSKTVDRWRDRGLASRRFLIGHRKRIGFLESSVDRFAKQHSEEMKRSRNFTQLSGWEREEIVRRARRMARYGRCPSEISKHLAKRMSRSPETIRHALSEYDNKHPHASVFPQHSSRVSDERKQEIFRSFRRGVPVERLAKQFCRSKGSIHRIISSLRAKRLLEQPIKFMDSEEFRMDNAEEIILQPPPTEKKNTKTIKPLPGLPPYLESLYAVPLLSREAEQYYFRKMNYLKYKACHLRETLGFGRPRSKSMDRIESLLDQYLEVKNFLIRSNLRLVVSLAKRYVKPGDNFFGIVSDGNMSLFRAIEKFDYTRGNKFSTYATWSIIKNFSRTISKEHAVQERYRTGTDELFQYTVEKRANHHREEMINQQQRQVIASILTQLDEREKNIIVLRFGLEQGVRPNTLAEVGLRLGVTKERIRQIESRALRKLQKIAQIQRLDIPGLEE